MIPEVSGFPDLMTAPEVASALRCATPTVYKLLRKGELRASKVGRVYRIHRESVLAFLRRGA